MPNQSVSLDGLSVSDLTALQAKIDEQIKVKHEEAKQQLKTKILALVADSGFTFSELFSAVKTPKAQPLTTKAKVKVKYSDGQNNWTGRGKMPLWVKAFIQGGGDLASLNILK